MRRTLAVLSALGVLASATAPALAASQGTGQGTGVEKTFLIPSSDGYGVAECLTTGGECGQVVADAWCESQGYAKSASYGIAAQDEYTGAIEAAPAVKTSERPIRITCRD
ncbi:hypothetical protein [Methylobacterium sp. SyP6R]|uniref:hypothetical protein n=1 Tax=Methylobacterium sp. SyP6R TaxID=2718876 RepID=UPI001F2CB6FC|nr:hypothetical protein [Methylobacterium sp. SyP6R]MCF4128339.1 hypothetical protein [Methylobacterium sp. SyP6R]